MAKTYKTCLRCNAEKHISDMSGSYCKPCNAERVKIYRKNNPEKGKEWDKKYRGSHPEKMRLHVARWYFNRLGIKSNIPEDLLKLKAQQLTLVNKAKEHKEAKNG